MAIDVGLIVGFDIDLNGVPFLNVSRFDPNTLNYDLNGAPFLGTQYAMAWNVAATATMARPTGAVTAEVGDSAAVTATMAAPTVVVRFFVINFAQIAVTMARPNEATAIYFIAIGTSTADVAATFARPAVVVSANYAHNSMAVGATMARPANVVIAARRGVRGAASVTNPGIIAGVTASPPDTISATLGNPAITGGNRITTVSTGWYGTHSDTGKYYTSGKMVVVIDASHSTGGEMHPGLAGADSTCLTDPSAYAGLDSKSVAVAGTGGIFQSYNSVGTLAVDFNAKLMWFQNGAGAAWNNNAAYSPGGLGGTSIAGLTEPIYLTFNSWETPGNYTVFNFDAGTVAGFSGWNGVHQITALFAALVGERGSVAATLSRPADVTQASLGEIAAIAATLTRPAAVIRSGLASAVDASCTGYTIASADTGAAVPSSGPITGLSSTSGTTQVLAITQGTSDGSSTTSASSLVAEIASGAIAASASMTGVAVANVGASASATGSTSVVGQGQGIIQSMIAATLARPDEHIISRLGERLTLVPTLARPSLLIVVSNGDPISIAATFPRPVIYQPPHDFARWNPLDSAGSINVSADGQIATVMAAGSVGIRTDIGSDPGVLPSYFEMVVTGVTPNTRIGVSNGQFVLSTTLGSDYDFTSLALDSQGNIWNGAATVISDAPVFGSGDVVMFYGLNDNIWVGVNGSWMGGPYPGALGYVDLRHDPMHLTYTDTDAAGATVTFNTNAKTYVYPQPGAMEWDSVNNITQWNPADGAGSFSLSRDNGLIGASNFLTSTQTLVARATTALQQGCVYFEVLYHMPYPDATMRVGLATADYDLSGQLGDDLAGQSIGWDEHGNLYQSGVIVGQVVSRYTDSGLAIPVLYAVVDLDTSQIWVGGLEVTLNDDAGSHYFPASPFNQSSMVAVNTFGKPWRIAMSGVVPAGTTEYVEFNTRRTRMQNQSLASQFRVWDDFYAPKYPGIILAEGVSLTPAPMLPALNMAIEAEAGDAIAITPVMPMPIVAIQALYPTQALAQYSASADVAGVSGDIAGLMANATGSVIVAGNSVMLKAANANATCTIGGFVRTKAGRISTATADASCTASGSGGAVTAVFALATGLVNIGIDALGVRTVVTEAVCDAGVDVAGDGAGLLPATSSIVAIAGVDIVGVGRCRFAASADAQASSIIDGTAQYSVGATASAQAGSTAQANVRSELPTCATADGSISTSFDGVAIIESVAEADASASVTGEAGAITEAAGMMDGQSISTATGAANNAAIGTAGGVGQQIGHAARLAASRSMILTVADIDAIGEAIVDTTSAIDVQSSSDATGQALGIADGRITGVTISNADAAATTVADASAAGMSEAAGASAAVTETNGSSAGAAMVQGDAQAISAAGGACAGSAAVAGQGVALVPAEAQADGHSTCQGTTRARVEARAACIGASAAIADGATLYRASVNGAFRRLVARMAGIETTVARVTGGFAVISGEVVGAEYVLVEIVGAFAPVTAAANGAQIVACDLSAGFGPISAAMEGVGDSIPLLSIQGQFGRMGGAISGMLPRTNYGQYWSVVSPTGGQQVVGSALPTRTVVGQSGRNRVTV